MMLPMLGSMFAFFFIRFTDTQMVSAFGKGSLSGSGLASSIYGFLFVFIIGFYNGNIPLLSPLISQKKYKEASKLLGSMLFVQFFFVSFSIFFIYFIVRYNNYWFQNFVPIIREKGSLFLKILAPSMIPSSFFYLCRKYLDVLKKGSYNLFFSFFIVIANIIINYFFIYGLFSFKGLGFVGAAWSTLFCRSFVAISYGWIMFFLQKKGLFYYRQFFSISYHFIKKSTYFGVPAGMGLTCKLMTVLALKQIAGKLGISVSDAMEIILITWNFSIMAPIAFANTACILVSQYYGKENNRIYGIGKIVFATTIIFFSITFFPIIFSKGYFILNLMNVHHSVAMILRKVWWIALLVCFIDCLIIVTSGLLRGLSDIFYPSICINLLSWFMGLPLSYFLCSRQRSIEAIFTAILISSVITLLLLVHRFYTILENKNKN